MLFPKITFPINPVQCRDLFYIKVMYKLFSYLDLAPENSNAMVLNTEAVSKM